MTERERNSTEEPRVVVRDRRKIDPETGDVRPVTAESAPHAQRPTPSSDTVPPGATPAAGSPAQDDGAAAQLRTQLDERTADVQRLQAEYANYRKRVDRDRELVVANAKAALAGELLTVLDDIERAEAHGDLTGAFKAVADKFVGVLNKAGLEPFGATGEPFDPSVHEAVQHTTSSEVAGPTVTTVLRRGYRFGDRALRAALVAVTDYEPPAESPAESPADSPASTDSPADSSAAAESTAEASSETVAAQGQSVDSAESTGGQPQPQWPTERD